MPAPVPPGVFVHERALVETDRIGAGTRVWAFAHVMEGAVVGEGCNICDGAFIESGAVVGNRVTVKNNVLLWDRVTVEDDVFLGPNAVFTNDFRPRAASKKGPDGFLATLVRQGATIGANVTVVCGSTIGRHAFVGAGSVVVGDVPSHALVVGNPARRIGWVCECGERLDEVALTCPCGRSYRESTTAPGLEQAG